MKPGKPPGLVHRDVNLSNLMIRRDGTVKVLDFGIAKARAGIRSSETVEGVLKGKFSYMSPEQVRGEELDPRSDVFTTAIVYHELVTGRRLFGGGDPMSTLMSIKSLPIPDPRKIISDIPRTVAEAALKGLARDRAKRYPSAGEIAAAPPPELADRLLGKILINDPPDIIFTEYRGIHGTLQS